MRPKRELASFTSVAVDGTSEAYPSSSDWPLLGR